MTRRAPSSCADRSDVFSSPASSDARSRLDANVDAAARALLARLGPRARGHGEAIEASSDQRAPC
jgi:hypothetical protein